VKTKFIIICILLTACMFASEPDFSEVMQQLLDNDSSYLQDRNRWERDKAVSVLNKSLNLADVNIMYQNYLNDITREEDKTSDFFLQEYSSIDEDDERWQIELSKSIFPKDFDDSDDNIGNSLDILESKIELLLSNMECQSDIIADFIDWYEATEMVPLIQLELDMLQQENRRLTTLQQQNIISPLQLIDNLEELEDKEARLHDYQEIIYTSQSKYNLELALFISSFQHYINQDIRPDTLNLITNCRNIIDDINRTTHKIDNQISGSRICSYFPEITGSVSYNWRNTSQDWDITVSEEKTIWERTQTEVYPEIRLEMSMPLNIWRNYQGKTAILSNYKHKLVFCQQLSTRKLIDLQQQRMGKLSKASAKITTRKQLSLLYRKLLETAQAMMKSEPDILGTTPQNRLNKAELKYQKAFLKYEIAEMYYFREIYLINNYGDLKE
jgi:hypothetical protein